jgi:hypothetical protein
MKFKARTLTTSSEKMMVYCPICLQPVERMTGSLDNLHYERYDYNAPFCHLCAYIETAGWKLSEPPEDPEDQIMYAQGVNPNGESFHGLKDFSAVRRHLNERKPEYMVTVADEEIDKHWYWFFEKRDSS